MSGLFEPAEVPGADPAGVGPELAPDDVDTSPRPEDGEQDVDQEANFESAETDDNEDDDDPEVHDIGGAV